MFDMHVLLFRQKQQRCVMSKEEDDASFLEFVAVDYSPEIVAAVRVRMTNGEGSLPALVSVLNSLPSKGYSHTEPFTSIPLPMELDLAQRRLRRIS